MAEAVILKDQRIKIGNEIIIADVRMYESFPDRGNVINLAFAYRFKTGKKVHTSTFVWKSKVDGYDFRPNGAETFNNRHAGLTGVYKPETQEKHRAGWAGS